MSTKRNRIDPHQRELSRRRFLANAGVAAVSVPVLGGLLRHMNDATESLTAPSLRPQGKPYPSYPKYHFAIVNHATTAAFFVAVQYGAADACSLLGCTYEFVGPETQNIPLEVDALNTAIDKRVAGIGISVIDPIAFNSPIDNALNEGIPVVAYNAHTTNPDNHVMAYIGQDGYTAGQTIANEMLSGKYVGKGDLVVGFIGSPGSLNLQPRINGTEAVLKAAGVDFVQVGGFGQVPATALSAYESWYLGHRNVKFLYSVDQTPDLAVVMKKYNLPAKGIHCAGFDLNTPIPTEVSQGLVTFTVDQQGYLQGFLPILQCFMYQISGGLISPVDTETGIKIVNKETIGAYLAYTDRYEGSSASEKLIPPPKKIVIG